MVNSMALETESILRPILGTSADIPYVPSHTYMILSDFRFSPRRLSNSALGLWKREESENRERELGKDCCQLTKGKTENDVRNPWKEKSKTACSSLRHGRGKEGQRVDERTHREKKADTRREQTDTRREETDIRTEKQTHGEQKVKKRIHGEMNGPSLRFEAQNILKTFLFQIDIRLY